MRPLNQPLHAHDQIMHADLLRRGRKRRPWKPDVHDAFQHDHVFHSRLIERVLLEARQAVYAEFHSLLRRIMKNPVANDSRIEHPALAPQLTTQCADGAAAAVVNENPRTTIMNLAHSSPPCANPRKEKTLVDQRWKAMRHISSVICSARRVRYFIAE